MTQKGDQLPADQYAALKLAHLNGELIKLARTCNQRMARGLSPRQKDLDRMVEIRARIAEYKAGRLDSASD